MRFARRPLALAASALVLQLTAGTTLADPGYYLATPYDRAEQAWADLRYGSVKSPGRPELGPMQWQNDMTPTLGEWPPDLALQTDFGRTQVNANLFFERSVDPEGAPPIQLRYQWQVKHRWKSLMNFGLQGFGEVGRWNDWPAAKDRSHRAGPALFGQWDLGRGGDEALLYQAAYLLGRVYRRQGDLFTVRLQYSF